MRTLWIVLAIVVAFLVVVKSEALPTFQSPPPPPCECDNLNTPQCLWASRCIKWWCSPCGEGGFYWDEWVTMPFVSPLSMPPHYHLYLPVTK